MLNMIQNPAGNMTNPAPQINSTTIEVKLDSVKKESTSKKSKKTKDDSTSILIEMGTESPESTKTPDKVDEPSPVKEAPVDESLMA